MAIRWDKLTVKAQDAVQTATTLASDNGNPELQPTHLLLALLQDKEGIVAPVLQKAGANPDALRARLEQALATFPKISGDANQAQPSKTFLKVVEQAFQEASNFKD